MRAERNVENFESKVEEKLSVFLSNCNLCFGIRIVISIADKIKHEKSLLDKREKEDSQKRQLNSNKSSLPYHTIESTVRNYCERHHTQIEYDEHLFQQTMQLLEINGVINASDGKKIPENRHYLLGASYLHLMGGNN